MEFCCIKFQPDKWAKGIEFDIKNAGSIAYKMKLEEKGIRRRVLAVGLHGVAFENDMYTCKFSSGARPH